MWQVHRFLVNCVEKQCSWKSSTWKKWTCIHLASTEPRKSKDSLRLGHVGSLRTRAIQNILSSGQDWLLRKRRERRVWIWRTRLWHLLRPHLLSDSDFFFQGRWRWEKRNPQDELVIAFFDTSRAHFHSSVCRKVAIPMQGDPSCPSGIAMLNCAMYGTRNAAQCFDSVLWTDDGEVGLQHWCVQAVFVRDILSKTLVYSDTVMIFATLATRTQITELKEDLSKHSTRETHCNIGSATTTPWRHAKYDFWTV